MITSDENLLSGEDPGAASRSDVVPPSRKYRVVFLCTENSARSQIAYAFMRNLVNGQFAIYSAGSRPKESIDPLAARLLRDRGIDIADLKPKHYSALPKVKFDFAISLCEIVPQEIELVSEQTSAVQWELPNPTAFRGSDEEKYRYFTEIASLIERYVKEFIRLLLLPGWLELPKEQKQLDLIAIDEKLQGAEVFGSLRGRGDAQDDPVVGLSGVDKVLVYANLALRRLFSIGSTTEYSVEVTEGMRKRNRPHGKLVVDEVKPIENSVFLEVSAHRDPSQPAVSPEVQKVFITRAKTSKERQRYERAFAEMNEEAAKKD